MKHRAILFIVIAGLSWGSSGLFVHALAPFGFSSPQMVLMRGLISALGMVLYAVFCNRSLFRVTGKELLLFIGSGLSMFLTATTYYIAMQLTSVSTAVVLMYTAPIFVMAYSVAFLGEKMTKKKFVSVVCMLVGCSLVSGIVGGFSFHWVGVILGLCAGISYSAYNVFTKIQMSRKSNPVSASMYTFIFMVLFALCVGQPAEIVQKTVENISPILPLFLGLGLFTGLLPYFLYTLSLKSLPAGTAASLGIIEPMSATVYSVLFLSETLSLPAIVGIILILGAIFLLSRESEA